QDDIRGGVEPDDVAELPQERTVFRADDHAATGGNDAPGGIGGGQCGEQLALPRAEAVLAFFGEDSGDWHAGALLDLRVHVHQRVAEELVQLAADGGFSTAHEADENDVLRRGFQRVHAAA